jgi:hypothetical protein
MRKIIRLKDEKFEIVPYCKNCPIRDHEYASCNLNDRPTTPFIISPQQQDFPDWCPLEEVK